MAKKVRLCRAVESNVGERRAYKKQLLKIQDDFSKFVLNEIFVELQQQNILALDSVFIISAFGDMNNSSMFLFFVVFFRLFFRFFIFNFPNTIPDSPAHHLLSVPDKDFRLLLHN